MVPSGTRPDSPLCGQRGLVVEEDLVCGSFLLLGEGSGRQCWLELSSSSLRAITPRWETTGTGHHVPTQVSPLSGGRLSSKVALSMHQLFAFPEVDSPGFLLFCPHHPHFQPPAVPFG